MGWLQRPKPRRWWWRGWWQVLHIGGLETSAVADGFDPITVNLRRRPGDGDRGAVTVNVVMRRVITYAHHNAFNLRFSRYLARTTAFALRHNAHGGSPNRVCAAYAAVVPHSGRTF